MIAPRKCLFIYRVYTPFRYCYNFLLNAFPERERGNKNNRPTTTQSLVISIFICRSLDRTIYVNYPPVDGSTRSTEREFIYRLRVGLSAKERFSIGTDFRRLCLTQKSVFQFHGLTQRLSTCWPPKYDLNRYLKRNQE